MTFDPVQLLGLGAATGTRASLTLLGLAGYAWLAPGRVPAGLRVLASPVALGAIVAVAIFELAAERDDDLVEMLGAVHSGIRAAAGGALGIAASGQGWDELGGIGAGALGASVALAVSTLRPRLHAVLRQLETEAFSPRRWANRLEEGGVLGVAVAVYAAPTIAAGIVVLGIAGGFVAREVARRAEARYRRPCPMCRAPIRVEASGCFQCRAEVPRVRHLDLRFLGALRDQARGAVAAAAAEVTGRLASPDADRTRRPGW